MRRRATVAISSIADCIFAVTIIKASIPRSLQLMPMDTAPLTSKIWTVHYQMRQEALRLSRNSSRCSEYPAFLTRINIDKMSSANSQEHRDSDLGAGQSNVMEAMIGIGAIFSDTTSHPEVDLVLERGAQFCFGSWPLAPKTSANSSEV